MNEPRPLVTVVTINFNDEAHLKETIESVLAQTWPHLEYLVVDGGSTDSSMEIIKKYEERINRWVSEPDKGTFDAMNKAVGMARGEFINFMNAGDRFASPTAIANMFAEGASHCDLLYGNHEVVYPSFSKHKKGKPASGLWRHMMFSHQSLFCRASLLKAQPFDLNYRIAADFHFIYSQFVQGKKFCYRNVDVARYLAGGKSEVAVLEAYRENRRIVLQHDKRLKTRAFHFRLMLKQQMVVALRKALAPALFEKIMKWKNSMALLTH